MRRPCRRCERKQEQHRTNDSTDHVASGSVEADRRSDGIHPARDGAGSLYTREHFLAVRDRLNEGGVFCQWLPLYQLDSGTLRIIIRTFLDAFPDGSAYLAHFSLRQPIVGLVGRKGPSAVSGSPHGCATSSSRPGSAACARGTTTACSAATWPARRRWVVSPAMVRGTLTTSPWWSSKRLASHTGPGSPLRTGSCRSLRRFMLDRKMCSGLPAGPRIGRSRSASPLTGRLAMATSAREPECGRQLTRRPCSLRCGSLFLAAVHLSRDFEPAYEPLVALAARLRASAPEEADALLFDLEKANPWRGEARALRDEAVQSSGRSTP